MLYTFLSIFMFFFFFFNDTATTEIYTLSLHDALPICERPIGTSAWSGRTTAPSGPPGSTKPLSLKIAWWPVSWRDRKSTRLNSSHGYISYAVFCLKKKKIKKKSVKECEKNMILRYVTT